MWSRNSIGSGPGQAGTVESGLGAKKGRPWLGNLIFFCTRALHAATGVGPTCRFEPTCSQYAQQALGLHGLFRGTYLTLRRLLRCHPWGRSGWDPVPGGEQR